jgi:predicted O-methyltransferase YrrM
MSNVVNGEAERFHSYLPVIRGMASGLRQGRNVYEGTQRGWGLQYGNLRQAVLDDAIYQEALAAAAGRTIVANENRMNIFLLLRFFIGALPAGDIIEFGSYKGGNAIFMAHVCRRLHPGTKVYALDTFQGMPSTDKAIDAHNAGDFADVLFDELDAYVRSLHLDNLVLVRGRFEETAQSVLGSAGPIRLAHVDCDIASAVSYSYDIVRPAMVDGGYIVIDDATVSSCLGATEVVEDLVIRRDGLNSEQIWPHFVFRHFATR